MKQTNKLIIGVLKPSCFCDIHIDSDSDPDFASLTRSIASKCPNASLGGGVVELLNT